ncbi:MAG: hypothetical protein ACPGGH_05965 [Chitinophagales bacterium]
MQHHKQPLMSRCLGTLLLSLLLITGCKIDEFVCLDGLVVYETESSSAGIDLSDYVIIACEGSFTRGNASIDLYNPSTGDLLPNAFAEQAGYALGDILQDVYWTNNDLILVVNNSQKIEMLDPNTLTPKRTIAGFTSPRYAHVNDEGGIYVSDLFSRQFIRSDPQSGCIDAAIDLYGWTEYIFPYRTNDIAVLHRSVYGQGSPISEVLLLSKDLELRDNIVLPEDPIQMVEGSEGHIFYVLSIGNVTNEVAGQIVEVNLLEKTTREIIRFNEDRPNRIAFDKNSNTLYFNLASDIFKIVGDTPPSLAWTTTAQAIYGLSVLNNGDVIVSDAKDFVINGAIEHYDSSGNLIRTVNVGYVPSEVVDHPQ